MEHPALGVRAELTSSLEVEMRAVITAGGTSEPIDDVRVITNLSSGRFGAALANALVERGVHVTLLAGKTLASHPEWVDRTVHIVPYGSTRELDAALRDEVMRPPDLLFMAAAVSDYSPVRTQGKIRSDQEELVIHLQRNPKILGTLRERCGHSTFLVGFKLLSSVSPEELQQVAHQQVKRCRLNLCIANDLSELSRERHPLWLVTPEGGAIRCEGSKATVAARVADFAMKRARVRWHKSVQVSGEERETQVRETLPGTEGSTEVDVARDPAHAIATALLQTAISAGLLPGTDGNVSARARGGLWTTPRQVDKSQLRAADLIRTEVDAVARRISYRGPRKPSIDTAVHAALYRALPDLNGIVHFHDAIVLPDATTSFPWPCGTVEEADEILATLANAAFSSRWNGGDFALHLVEHGYLLGLTAPASLGAAWQRANEGYRAHLDDIGVQTPPSRCIPVFHSAQIVGVSARFDLEETVAWSTWLLPETRGSGLGDRVIEAISAKRRRAIVADRCDVIDFYAERGWKPLSHSSGVAVLAPPTERTDLIPAVSICLLDPVRRAVLLGHRRTEPWRGYWAFPGGRIEAGESGLEAALRELHEETGISLETAQPLRERTVTVGADRGFSVTNYLIPVFHAPEPTPSDEIDPRWVPLGDAAALRPMAAGTRRILRELLMDIGP